MKSETIVFGDYFLCIVICILSIPQLVLTQDTYNSTTPVTISNGAFANATVTVSDTFFVSRVAVYVSISHANVQQLTIRLKKGSTEIILVDSKCSNKNNIAVLFDDSSANPFACSAGSDPALEGIMQSETTTLSVFAGFQASGTWTLSVFDNGAPTTGTLNVFGLYLYQPLTSGEVTSGPLTSSPLTTSPVTSSPLTSSEITSAEMTSSPLTTSPLTSSPLTTSPLTTSEITSVEMTSSEITSVEMTSSPLTSSPLTTSPVTSSPLTTSPLTTSEITSAEMTTSPLTSAELTTAQLTSSPLTTSPVTTFSVTSSPLTSSPLTSSPLTSSPLTSSPLTTSPLTSSPVTSSPLTTVPLFTTSPLTTSPVTTAPATTALTSSFLTTSPLTTARLTTSPLTSSPVTSGAVTSNALTTRSITSGGLTTRGLTSGPFTSSPLTTNPLTTSPLTTGSFTSSPLTTSPLTTSPLTSSPLTTSPLTTSPLTTGEVTSSPLTTSPLTSSPLTTSPLTSGQVIVQDDSAQTTDGEGKKGNGAGAAAAGVVVSILVISALIVGFLLYRRRKQQKPKEPSNSIELGKRNSSISEYASGPLQALENVLLAYPKFGPIKAIAAVTQVTEADKLANDFVNIFEVHGKTVELIKIFIATEVKLANHSGSLMRANSMASKVMKSFSFLVGKEFLKKTLTKNIQEIMDKPIEDGVSCEVDPDKLKTGEELSKNQARLQKVCSNFLRGIFDSIDVTPLEFHEICKTLQEKVAAKFPESAQTCIGGFLFLRFFCPAICTPNSPIFGIVKASPSADSSRALTLIAKTLQNVANNVTFGNKEQYMEFLNDFIMQNFLACQDYFDSMAIIPKSGTPACDPNRITLETKVKAMEHLFSHMKTIWPKLEEKYKTKSWFPNLKEAFDTLVAKEKQQVELERSSVELKK